MKSMIALVLLLAIVAAASAQYVWSNGYYGSPYVASSWPVHHTGAYWGGAYSPYVSSYYLKK